jgi:simple sugar transport system permease protein
MNKIKLKKFASTNEAIVAYTIIVLCLVIGLANPAFFSFSTTITLARAMLITLIFAALEMVIIISGGIDVSFPAIACFSAYATMRIILKFEIDSIAFFYICASVIGLGFGAINAYLVAKRNISPLIATLGVSSIANGATLAFLGTREFSNIPSHIDSLSKSFLYSFTNSSGIKYQMTTLILIPIILLIALFIILKFTTFGRGIYAIGGDENAARIAGFNVVKIKSILYMFSGVLASIGGVTYTILMRQSSPQNLMGAEMMVIAAVVVGGTRITGGHGTVLGTVLGVLLIAIVQNNLVMVGIPTSYQTFVVGLIIVLGTGITSIKAKHIANSAKI